MGKKPVIIAVNSVSGGGKTAITNELLGKLQNAEAIYFDDYKGIDKNIPNINKWVEDGADYSLWDLQVIADDINKLLEENLDYIVLDYPFGYKHEQIAGFIDLSVYIDTPLDIALARRILRDYSPQGKTDSILKDLDAYLHKRNAYHYAQTVHTDADLTVDGSLKTGDIADIIVKKVKEIK